MDSASSSGNPIVADPRQRYFLGTALLLGVVLLWVSSSFLMNSMFTEQSYNKPFLITYLCTATFTLYLVRPAFAQFRHLREAHAGDHLTTNSLGSQLERIPSKTSDRILSSNPKDAPLTVKQTAALALLFCGLWFAANWAMNAALGYTTVSSTTILSSMSGFFTLAVGACVGVEIFTPGKLASVVFSIIGVIILSQHDASLPSSPSTAPNLPTRPLLGDMLALLSALAYAFYVILLKVRIRTESRVAMTTFFGFVGAFNILLIWPIGVILHFTQIEKFEWPHGGKLWLGILINAAITFVSDALYLKAMLMTSPIQVTLGLSLTIPFAFLGDFYRGTPLGWKTVTGGILVLGSFLANGLMDLAAQGNEEPQQENRSRDGETDSERERLLANEEEAAS